MTRPVVLVTGAARRLGRVIACELAGAGFDLAVHFRTSPDEAAQTVREVERLGARAAAFDADLSDEAACQALLPRVEAKLGAVFGLVNSASVFDYDDLSSFSFQSLERHMRVNVAPALVLARALADSLHRAGGSATGCVVNLLDQKLWNLDPDYLSYTLSKAALLAATRTLALSLAPRVRVCSVAPGITLPSGEMSREDFELAQRRTPLGRATEPQDVARAVRFLLESPTVTGTNVLVDAGQHLVALGRDVAFVAAPASGKGSP